jgi:hypothetical protein
MAFRRVLKSWMAQYPNLRYWQGVDSIAAPLLALFWPDEALTFAVLGALTARYAHGFFLPDNTACLNLYLATFCQLINFHDPELASHLDTIGFTPDHYLVPWFMTLFAHVLPMEQLYRCWDMMVQGPSAFPLFIAVAVMISLRDILLARDVTGCMMFFSNVLTIDMDEMMRLSLITLECTPPSFVEAVAQFNTHRHGIVGGLAPLPSVILPDAIEPSFFRRSGSSSPDGKLNLLVPPRLSLTEWLIRREYATVVDIRPHTDFAAQSWPGSLNIPWVDGHFAHADLQHLLQLAHRNYANANFNAFLVRCECMICIPCLWSRGARFVCFTCFFVAVFFFFFFLVEIGICRRCCKGVFICLVVLTF